MNWVIFASHLDRFSVNETLDRLGIEFRTLFGCWKGIPEESYMVTHSDYLRWITGSIVIRGQESILMLTQLEFDGFAGASLLELTNNSETDLGFFGAYTGVSKHNEFTLDPKTGLTFICTTDWESLSLQSAEDIWEIRDQKSRRILDCWDWHR